jgi:galactan 5-O-arabinofuranosyltransferase
VAAWVLPAALTSAVQSLVLFGTPFYLFGTNGDQFFRMQYLQRLATSPALADGNYAGLPPFYPAGWFWLGGRFADILDLPAWAAYKPFAILTIAATSSLSYVLWSLVVSRRKALVVAVVFSIAGLMIGTYEPYSWLAKVFVPPLAVLAWRLFRSVAERRNERGLGPATLLIGLGISITAATYTLVFTFVVLLVLVMAVAAVVVARRDRTTVVDRRTIKRVAVRLALIAAAALPVTLLTWGPYLCSAIRMPTASNAAAMFFPIGMATLGTPMLRFSIDGVICMTGLLWIVFSWRRSAVAQAFGITALSCVLWQVLSTLALTVHTTLLGSHIAEVGTIVLWCACALAVVDLVELVPQRFTVNRRSVQMVASVLAVLVTVELTQTTPPGIQNLRDAAFRTYDADGHAVAASNPNSPGIRNGQLITAIAQLTGRKPQDDILLTNNYQLLDFQPYFCFQTNKEQYANPLARYPERNAELEQWAQSPTSADFMAALSSSKFATPNVFVFTRDEAGNYPFDLNITNFPYENQVRRIVFPAELFDSASFASREVGPYTVIVRV